jgi:hypothetical protein
VLAEDSCQCEAVQLGTVYAVHTVALSDAILLGRLLED